MRVPQHGSGAMLRVIPQHGSGAIVRESPEQGMFFFGEADVEMFFFWGQHEGGFFGRGTCQVFF